MPALFGPCQAAWMRRLVEFSITPTITLITTNTAPTVLTMMVAQSARVQISRSVRLVNQPEMCIGCPSLSEVGPAARERQKRDAQTAMWCRCSAAIVTLRAGWRADG
jgi:hypothetical protein